MLWFNKKRRRLEEMEIISSQMNGRKDLLLSLLEKMDNLTILLQEMNKKLDMVVDGINQRYKISPIEKRRKEEILSILKEKKSLSIYNLSGILGLSRTRCNELLKSLENEGIVESMRVGKKKIYRITPG